MSRKKQLAFKGTLSEYQNSKFIADIENKFNSTLKEAQSNFNNLQHIYNECCRNNYPLKNPQLPENFDLNKLGEDFFREKSKQNKAVPFSDDFFINLIKIDKVAIKNEFCCANNGKIIHGFYCEALDFNKKPYLFAVNIIHNKDIKNIKDFNLKLHFYCHGENWIDLARIDGEGEIHGNIQNAEGKVYDTADEVDKIETPHMHLTNQDCQLLHSKLDYMPAVALKQLLQFNEYERKIESEYIFNKVFNDKAFAIKLCEKFAKIPDESEGLPYFIAFVDFFLTLCGVDIQLNKNYNGSCNDLLFDTNAFKLFGNTTEELVAYNYETNSFDKNIYETCNTKVNLPKFLTNGICNKYFNNKDCEDEIEKE